MSPIVICPTDQDPGDEFSDLLSSQGCRERNDSWSCWSFVEGSKMLACMFFIFLILTLSYPYLYIYILYIKAKHVEFRESLLYGGFSTIPVSSSLLGEVFPNLPKNASFNQDKVAPPTYRVQSYPVTMTWIFQFQQQKKPNSLYSFMSIFSQLVLESLNPYDATRLGDLSSERDFEVPNFIKHSLPVTSQRGLWKVHHMH